jgi:hypothetical protein
MITLITIALFMGACYAFFKTLKQASEDRNKFEDDDFNSFT